MSLFDPLDLDTPEIHAKPISGARRTDPQKQRFVAAHRRSRAAAVIGTVEPGETLHVISAAEWSTHDVIAHLLGTCAPAALWFSTWSMSEDALRIILREKNEGRITEVHALVDWWLHVRHPAAKGVAMGTADRIGTTSCHAKVYLLDGADHAYSIQTSANLTNNPRLESYVITESREVLEFHQRWLDASLKTSKPFESAKTCQQFTNS